MTKTIPVLENYEDHEGKEQTASVNLTIDYTTKTYSIESGCKDGAFRFQNNSHKHNMWKALASLVQKAIEFAEEELKQ